MDEQALRLPNSGRSAFDFAAALYRIALTAFLPLVFEEEPPSDDDTAALGEWAARRMEFQVPQRDVEEALLKEERA